MNLKKEKKNRGFTLLEMLISISLFTVVTTIAFSALFSIMDANDKAKTIKLVVNNLSTAMESMTREIRVGTDYTCNGSATPISGGYDCPSGEDQISFISESGEDVSYWFDEPGKTMWRKIGSSTVTLVGEDVNIDNLKFYVVGNGTESPSVQPRTLIVLKGSMARKGQKIKTVFDLQTTVSQRNPAK